MKKLVFSTLLLAFGANLAACQTTALDSAGPTASTGDAQSGAFSEEEKAALKTLTGYDYPAQIDGMLEFCKESMPPAVIRKVPVKGYADESCNSIHCATKALFEGYEFIEFRNVHRDYANNSTERLLFGKTYRAAYAPSTSKKCSFWRSYVDGFEGVRRTNIERKVTEGNCVVFNEIEDFTANYHLRAISRKNISVPGFHFNFRGQEVFDVINNEVIGSKSLDLLH